MFSRATGFLLHAFTELNLAPQRWQPQLNFFNFQLIRFWVCTPEKTFVGRERLLIFSKIIMRRGNEIIRYGQIWFLPEKPRILVQSRSELLQFIQGGRQICMGGIVVWRGGYYFAQNGGRFFTSNSSRALRAAMGSSLFAAAISSGEPDTLSVPFAESCPAAFKPADSAPRCAS